MRSLHVRRFVEGFCFLRCPRCGNGSLFKSAFGMHGNCSACSLSFSREGGYYVGSIYINYAMTAASVLIAFLLVGPRIPPEYELIWWSAISLALSMAYFRHSRSLWLAIDYLIDPWGTED